jgi:hypothetical protein
LALRANFLADVSTALGFVVNFCLALPFLVSLPIGSRISSRYDYAIPALQEFLVLPACFRRARVHAALFGRR